VLVQPQVEDSNDNSTDIDYRTLKKCDEKNQNGSVCYYPVEEIRPLQFGIAGIEVECKKNRLESMSDKKLERYTRKRVNCVIAKKGVYLVDGHHTSRALLDADIKKEYKNVYCDVVANMVHLDQDDFWDDLLLNRRLWLFDEKGSAPLAPEHLPSRLSKMIDDPFRTLAWLTQHAGGFLKTGIDFEDFQWANFYRNTIDLRQETLIDKTVDANGCLQEARSFEYANLTSWDWCQVRPNSKRCLPNQLESLRRILPLAIKLAMSDEAKHLPGFGDGVASPMNCGNSPKLRFVNDAKEMLLHGPS